MKYQKYLYFLVLGVFSVVVLFVGCSKNDETSGKGETKDKAGIELKLAETHPNDFPTTLADKEFAKLVEEKTEGRVKIKVYEGSQLGEEKQVIEQIQFGGIDFARVSLSPVAEFSKDLNALQLPYIYKDSEHMWKVLNGPIGEKMLDSLSEKNILGLCYYDGGARSFYNTKKEIKSLDDLKGMKFRVMESSLMVGMVESLGAIAQPMDYGEVYSALKTGVIDGAENNFPSYISSNHYEVAKYYTIDAHSRVPELLIASTNSLKNNNVSDEDITLIKEAAKESVDYQKVQWEKTSNESKEKAEKAGCTITELDSKELSKFQESVQSLYEKEGKDFMDIIKEIQDTK
ncbi:MAG: TRAP transporter substrate-binding protein [Clostridiales bacterium]